jgi:acetyl esterase
MLTISDRVAVHPDDLARVIADDHAKVNAIIGHLERATGDRRALVDVLIHDLTLHIGAEEIVLYPGLRELDGGALTVDQSLDDHQVMKDALAVLSRGNPGGNQFEKSLTILIGAIRAHAPDEDDHVLAAVRAALGDERMIQLGRDFIGTKRSLPTRPHPHAPATPPGNLIGGSFAAMFDNLRDRLSGRSKEFASDHSGLLAPDAQAVVDAFGALGRKPIELLDPDDAREQPTPADAVKAVLHGRGLPVDPEPVGGVDDLTIPGPAGELAMRVYRPIASDDDGDEPLPVVVYFHGGGWVIADLDVYDATPRALANRAHAIVASVGYRRAPEHPFPAAHDDALAATRWVHTHAEELRGDPTRVAVAGESAGANMAAATCLQLMHAGGPAPQFQLLIYPVASGLGGTPSYDDCADAVPLNRAMMGWFVKHTFPDPVQALDPRVDLVNVPLGDLRGLPPTLVITAQRDPLRDEGEAFARRLALAGVEVTATRYNGVPHEFFGMGAVVEAAQRAVNQAAAELTMALGPAMALH